MREFDSIVLSIVIAIILSSIATCSFLLFSPAKYIGENKTSIKYFQCLFIFLAIDYVLVVFANMFPWTLSALIKSVNFFFIANLLYYAFKARFGCKITFYKTPSFWLGAILFYFLSANYHLIFPDLATYFHKPFYISNMINIAAVIVSLVASLKLLIKNKKSPKVSVLTITGIGTILVLATYLFFTPFIFSSYKLYVSYAAIGTMLIIVIFIGTILTMFMNDLVELHRTQSITDAMTGVYNRRFFTEQSEILLSAAKRKNEALTILICDIDKFKNVNDTYGHDVGDLAIIEFSKTLKATLRTEDLFARFGGEEFVALLPGIELEKALLAAERLRKNTELISIPTSQGDITFTASFGVSDCTTSGISEGLKNADNALYQAKTSGRNQVAVT
jgi:diguanylate cyclase (GGDEF)-like protein